MLQPQLRPEDLPGSPYSEALIFRLRTGRKTAIPRSEEDDPTKALYIEEFEAKRAEPYTSLSIDR